MGHVSKEYKVNVLDLNFGKPTIIINDKDAQELGITLETF